MEKTDGLFEEMSAFLTEDAAASEAGTKDPDDDGLPYESFEDFSTEPVEFGELAERMLHKVENLFDLTAVFNRHSEKYLKACVLLEKGIKFLGSACLTKIALEHREYTFPDLSQLSTMKLYRMASFNYRKLDAALTEKLEKGNDLYPELLDMEFRYFNLLRRLRSTETKIYNYHLKKYYGEENYDPVVAGNAFTKQSWTKGYTQDREEAPAFRSAPAFPIIFQNMKPEISDKRSTVSGGKPAAGGIECPDRKTGNEVKVSGSGVQVSDQNGASGMESSEKVTGPGSQVSGKRAAECGKSEAVEADISHSSLLISHSSDPASPSEGTTPAFVGIMETVLKRSEENEDGGLSFTLDEIEQLADDPEFNRFDPDLAASLRRVREQIPNSS